jgi:hypothetical protein
MEEDPLSVSGDFDIPIEHTGLYSVKSDTSLVNVIQEFRG